MSDLDDLVEAPEHRGLRELWWRLALGVAVHRYFLHVDRALEIDTGLSFQARRALARPAGAADWRGLRRRLGLDEAPPPRPAASHAAGDPLGAVASLGALGVAVDRGATPAWYGVLGLLPVHDGSRARALRNVFLGFLYAGRRESGDGRPLPELARALEQEHGAALSAVERCARSADDEGRERIERAAASIGFSPAADLALTLGRSRRVWELYASGLGVGQG